MLAKNVTATLAVTDQYVWLWGEKGRWWPAPGNARPGRTRLSIRSGLIAFRCIEALLESRDPEGAQQRQCRADVRVLPTSLAPARWLIC